MSEIAAPQPQPENKSNFLKIVGIIFITVLLSVGITIWVINHYIFPTKFDPVVLNQRETTQLDEKLEIFSWVQSSNNANQSNQPPTLDPEKYSEKNAKREISLSEREVNALLAKNTNLASKLAIDLSDNLASGKLLVPMDEDFPILGGKTLKISAGIELAFTNERPIVKLQGVSIMGVPIPNAWLGGMKNVDLVNEFGQDEGFWKSFSEGVEHIKITDGSLVIKLKE